MPQSTQQEYYVARAATSRALAQRAASPGIAAIHAELAARYEMLATQPDRPIDGAIRRCGGDPQTAA